MSGKTSLLFRRTFSCMLRYYSPISAFYSIKIVSKRCIITEKSSIYRAFRFFIFTPTRSFGAFPKQFCLGFMACGILIT